MDDELKMVHDTNVPTDDVHEVEMIINQIEMDIERIWNNVILPYKMDICRAYILDKIDENEYHKFYEFMITHNEAYKKAKEFLAYIKE